MQPFLLILVGVVVLVMGEASAQIYRYQGPDGRIYLTQVPPAQQPTQNLDTWRQEWLAYERELRAWCTTTYPDMLSRFSKVC